MSTSRTLTIAGYLLLTAAAVALDAYGRHPRTRVPSLAHLCGFVMRDKWGRIGLLLLWWWLGWHFLARS
jgi:hypothetical protein